MTKVVRSCKFHSTLRMKGCKCGIISTYALLFQATLIVLQVKSGPLLLHMRLPLPLHRIITLTSCSTNSFVYSSQFESKSWSQLLQTSSNTLYSCYGLSIWSNDTLLGLLLVAEDVPMSS